MMETVDLPTAIELAEKIKNAYRATWDETRYQDEASGQVTPTQYDVTLAVKGGADLFFSYRETEAGRKWVQRLLDPEADTSWETRHDRVERWVLLPDMLATLLWDIVTVHGDEAQKRGWSHINRGTAPEVQEVLESVALDDDTSIHVEGLPAWAKKKESYASGRSGGRSVGGGWTEHG